MQLVPISFGALFLLLMSPPDPAVPPQATATVQTTLFGAVIRSIEYSADPPLNRADYDSLIGLKPGDTLTRTGIKNAIQALHDTQLFASVVADADRTEDGVRLTFRLRRTYFFNEFNVEGDLDLEGRSLMEILRLPAGERYAQEKLEDAQQAVARMVEDRGYYLARIQTRTEVNHVTFQVDTVFAVQTGRQATLGSFRIEGVPDAEIKPIRKRLKLEEGKRYSHRKVASLLEGLKKYLVDRGYLAATPEISESFDRPQNSISLILSFRNFGKVRLALEGFKVPKSQWARLLPVLSGEGLDPDLLEEGSRNLKEYLEERGYSEAEVSYDEEREDSGVLVIRYKVTAGPRVSVAYVHFHGNSTLSTAELRGAVQVRPQQFLQKSVYSIGRLDDDVESLKNLHRAKGFSQAEVIPLLEPLDNGRKLGITFEVTEGGLERAGAVTITGNRALTTESLLAKSRLRPGAPFSTMLAEQDRQALLAAYNDAGFLHASVTYKIGEADPARSHPVEFEVQEGTRILVERILVLGNDRTRAPLIERRVTLKDGDPMSLAKMLKTQQSISDLGVFDNVQVSPELPDSDAPRQNMVVRVTESRRFNLRYGLGYDTKEKVRGILELSDINIFGRARRADLRLRASVIGQAAILTFQQSQVQFLPVNDYLSFSALQQEEVSFSQTKYTASYQFSKPINTHSWALLRTSYRNVRVYDLQVSAVLAREDSPRNLTTISAIYINDTRDNYVDAEKGFFTSTSFGITPRWLGSNNFVSLYSQNSYNRMLPAGVGMVVALRLGLAWPYGRDTSIPISERYFSGGASSLRGFKTDTAGPVDPKTGEPTGGNALIVGNLELHFPLLKPLSLACFYDTGNVFARVDSIRLSGFSHTAGLGLRVKTPLGPLRLDYGFNLNLPDYLRDFKPDPSKSFKPNQWFITIGPLF
jgi:outer membrane protein insertion porin family